MLSRPEPSRSRSRAPRLSAAGLAINKMDEEQRPTAIRGVDPALVLDRQIVGQALIITVLAIVSKVLGAGMGGTGMGLRSAAMIGMVPRGEVGLIVVSLGLSRGIIEPAFFSMVVVMSIVTTLIVSPALFWLSQPRVRRPVQPEASGWAPA